MSDLAAAPESSLMWSTPAGEGCVDLHLQILTPEGPAILVVHADRGAARTFAQGILAAAGDGFERTMSPEARS